MRTRSGNKERDILDAAVSVFARDGYHKAKMSKIAEEAGVATGSVYLYFENKEAILHSLFETLWLKLTEQFRAVTKRKDLLPQQKLDGMIDLLFDRFANNPDLAIVFVNEQQHLQRDGKADSAQYYKAFMDIGERVIRDGIKRGVFSKSIDVRVFRLFMFGGIRHLIRQWAQNPESIPLHAIRGGLKSFIRNGLSADHSHL